MIVRLLYFLSKTDPKLIKGCSTKAKYTQSSFGLFVLFTGLLALFSGSYALSMALGAKGDSDYLWPVCGGVIYSMIIMAFDREIVAASDKRAILIRVPLAIMIGIIVAIPLELRLLEGRINEELIELEKGKNKDHLDRRLGSLDQMENEEAKLRNEIASLNAEIAKWDSIKRVEQLGEHGRPAGKGTAWEHADKSTGLAQDRLVETRQEYRDFLDRKNEQKAEIENSYELSASTKSRDFLSLFIALQLLKKDRSTDEMNDFEKTEMQEQAWATKLISWGLTLLFVFIELFPALMKIFKEETDYDDLLLAQGEINRGIIDIKANHRLDEIEQNPSVVFKPDAIETIQQQMEVL